MKKLELILPTDKDKFHEQILSFFNFALEISKQEKKLLALLVKYNIEYKALDEVKRAKFILSSEIRKEIRTELSITEHNFNNLLHRLKKRSFFGKPLLDESGVLNSAIIIPYYSEGFNLSIKFIEEENNQIKSLPAEPVKATEVQKIFEPETKTSQETEDKKVFRLVKYPEIYVTYDPVFKSWVDSEGNVFPSILEAEPI